MVNPISRARRGASGPTVALHYPASASAPGAVPTIDKVEVDFNCVGALPGDSVSVATSAALAFGVGIGFCRVTADHVFVGYCNAGAANKDPGNHNVSITVHR